jgi:hypothetical protein
MNLRGAKGRSRERRQANDDVADITAIRTREIRHVIEKLRSRLEADEFLSLRPKDVWIELLRERRHVFQGRRYGHNGLPAPDHSQATLLSTLLSEAKKRHPGVKPGIIPAGLIVEAARLNQDLGLRQATIVLRTIDTLLVAVGDAAAARKRLDAAMRFLSAAGGIDQALQALAAAAAVADVTAARR